MYSTENSVWSKMETAIKSDNKLQGHRKIRVPQHVGEHKQAQEPKSNIFYPKDTLSGTNTNSQNEMLLSLTKPIITHSKYKEQK